MGDKDIFVDKLKKRIFKFGVDVILFYNSWKQTKASSVVTYQMVNSATSTGANVHAARLWHSQAEFLNKICTVAEEANESIYQKIKLS